MVGDKARPLVGRRSSSVPDALNASRHSITRKLPQRILPHPPGRRIRRFGQSPRHHRGGSMERAIAFADGTQSHVNGLFYEIARVLGFPFNENEALNKLFVAGTLVVYGEAPQQGKGGAFLELLAPAAPLLDLGPGVRRAIEQVEA